MLTKEDLLIRIKTATGSSNLTFSTIGDWTKHELFMFGLMSCFANKLPKNYATIESEIKTAFGVSSISFDINKYQIVWDEDTTRLLLAITTIAEDLEDDGDLDNSNGGGNSVVGSLGFDCFVIIGQSNAEGNGKPKDDYFDFSDPRIFNFSPGNEFMVYANKLILAKERILNIQGELPGDSTVISFTTGFAKNYLAENPTKRVCLIGCALGNTGFSSNHWNPGDPLYNTTVEVCNRFLTLYPDSKIKGFLWHQGERDIDNSYDPATYQTKLEAMIAALRTNITGCAEVPFITGNYSPNWSIGFPIKSAYEAANNSITKRIDYTGNVISTGLSGNLSGDEIHFDARSQRILSQRYYSQYKFALTNKLTIPDKPTSLTVTQYTGATLRVTFTQSNKADYSIVETRQGTTLISQIKTYNSKLLIPNLNHLTSYNISVKSVNNIGQSLSESITASTNNISVPLLSNPLVKLGYEDSTNLAANDGTLGLGTDGTLRQVIDVEKGKSIEFYQNSGIVSYNAIPSEFTFSTWVKLNSYRPEATFFGTDSGTATGKFNFGVNNASGLRISVNNVDLYVAPENFPLNQWKFVGVTYGSGVFKIYIDGEKVSTVNQTYTAASDNNPIWIGQKNFGYGSIRGFLNNTYLFNTVATELEMSKLYEISF